jgi:hypothetical protein
MSEHNVDTATLITALLYDKGNLNTHLPEARGYLCFMIYIP